MDNRELKKLSRRDLLEMLIEQVKENDMLRAELEEKNKLLADREIHIKECGSIAQAALELNGVFEAAQAAAEQYLENVRTVAGVKSAASAEKSFSRDSGADSYQSSYEKREAQIREVTEFLKQDEQSRKDGAKNEP